MKACRKCGSYAMNMDKELCDVCFLKRRIEELEAWKESAMQVLNDVNLQKIGKILKVPLGASIAEKIVPSLLAMQARIKELEAELDRLNKIYV